MTQPFPHPHGLYPHGDALQLQLSEVQDVVPFQHPH